MELPAPEKIRETAQQVLQSTDYRLEQTEDAFAPFWERLIDFFLWLVSLLFRLADMMSGLPLFFRWVIIITLVTLLVLIVGHIIYTVLTLARPVKLSAAKLDLDRRRSINPTELEQAAEQLSAQGRHIEAVRLLLKAALIRIETAFERPFRQGTTNREYLWKYRQLPVLEPVRLLVDQIDRCWYGEEPFSQEEFSHSRAAHASVLDFLKRGSHA